MEDMKREEKGRQLLLDLEEFKSPGFSSTMQYDLVQVVDLKYRRQDTSVGAEPGW